MGKGNLLLGQGRGKMGDVVFYMLDGEQAFRVRRRQIKNPNSFRQQVQRAIAANIQRIYSAGRIIFDHSFQGESVGGGNQRQFVSVNMGILRQKLAAEFAAGSSPIGDSSAARVGMPRVQAPAPFAGLVVSNGSYQQLVFSHTVDGFSMADFREGDLGSITIGQYARRLGLVPGDIYTFVVFGTDALAGDQFNGIASVDVSVTEAGVYPVTFAYAQIKVKDGVLQDDRVIETAETFTMAELFEPSDGVDVITGRSINSNISEGSIVPGATEFLAACIRSREDSGLRSRSVLASPRGWSAGLTYNYLSEAWANATEQVGDPELILEGSEFPTVAAGA